MAATNNLLIENQDGANRNAAGTLSFACFFHRCFEKYVQIRPFS
jgi:hypothetical protein